MFEEFLEFLTVNTDLTWNSGKQLLTNNSKWNVYEETTVLTLSRYKDNCITYTDKDKVKSTLTKPLIDYRTGLEVIKWKVDHV